MVSRNNKCCDLSKKNGNRSKDNMLHGGHRSLQRHSGIIAEGRYSNETPNV
jgi:hypothetical protein